MLKLESLKPKETPGLVTYEERLSRSPHWALQEGSMHFDKTNQVFLTLRRITAKLNEIGVPYALVGGLAMFHHGYRRFTEDVDLLVSRQGLTTIHERLEGLGYVPPFAGSKNLRDVDSGVKIEFLVEGDFPGDGKPKPISFPDPKSAATEIDDIWCIQLPKLVELKLASGTVPHRLKDLADVQEMIRVLSLPADLTERLDPSVRDSYRKLWEQVHAAPPEE
jgi:hypothetical protein